MFVTIYFCFISGVTITNVDDNTYEIFAPNKDAMDEAMEMVKSFFETKVCFYTLKIKK